MIESGGQRVEGTPDADNYVSLRSEGRDDLEKVPGCRIGMLTGPGARAHPELTRVKCGDGEMLNVEWMRGPYCREGI